MLTRLFQQTLYLLALLFSGCKSWVNSLHSVCQRQPPFSVNNAHDSVSHTQTLQENTAILRRIRRNTLQPRSHSISRHSTENCDHVIIVVILPEFQGGWE